MTDPILWIAPVLLWSMAMGLFQILRDPHPSVSLLAVLLMGTTGTGLMLLFACAGDTFPAALDVALVSSLLAAVVGVAFVNQNRSKEPSE